MGDARHTLGELLRGYRLGADLTQEELGRRAGVSVRAVRDIERDRVRHPRARSVRRLAAALRLDGAATEHLLSLAEPADRLLSVDVLGPLSVRLGDVSVYIGSRARRLLLALLAIQPGRVVSLDEIVDVVWEGTPPSTFPDLVYGHVARLRRAIGADHVVAIARSGYRLDLATDRRDLTRFDDLLDRGRRAYAAGAHDTAYGLFDAALHCWRGPVVADLGAGLAQHPAAVAVSLRRLAATTAYADVALALGRYAEAAARLLDAVSDEPVHEGLHARLMLALAGTGQQAESLRLFATLRTRLAEELGVEPGAELRAAHLSVLRQELPGATAPEQLPADVPAFTGRVRHLRELDALPALTVLTGGAGVGKTALAVHWAHRNRDRFPDGQLHVDLRGYAATEPVRPIQALARFLHALGVPPERVPVEVDEAAALYRSLLAGRRTLVVLDNAAGADQVRPLVPGGTGCVVLVTSRDRLAGLAAREGARRLAVDVLTEAEAVALLRRLLGPGLVDAEPGPARELARECARLPLALRIAAANLTGEPFRSIAGYLAELRAGGTLVGLSADSDDEAAVAAAFGHSYRRLAPGVRRVFRLLGLVPGPELTAEAAVALAGPVGGEAVQALAAAHLITAVAPARYAFHDLLRRYARERALTEDGEAACDAAVGRLYDWYLGTVDAGARWLYADKVRLPGVAPASAGFPDHTAAQAWLEVERPNLVAAVRHAAEHGPRPAAWRLADALRGYYWMRVYPVDWLAVARAGLTAAMREGDAMAQAAGYLNLASVHLRQSRYRQAIARYEQAVVLAERAGWHDGLAGALINLGSAYRQLGELDQAVEHQVRALALGQRIGDLAGQAIALDNLANAYQELGDLERAARHHGRALAIHRERGDRNAEAIGLTNLGDTELALGRPDEAMRLLTRALVVHREVGDRGGESETLRIQAEVYREQGRYVEALDAAAAALAIARDTGDRRFEADALNTAGAIHCGLLDTTRAIDHHTRALRLARETESRPPETMALIGLAEAYHRLGRTGEASRRAGEALALAERYGLRLLEARARAILPAAV